MGVGGRWRPSFRKRDWPPCRSLAAVPQPGSPATRATRAETTPPPGGPPPPGKLPRAQNPVSSTGGSAGKNDLNKPAGWGKSGAPSSRGSHPAGASLLFFEGASEARAPILNVLFHPA